MMAQVKPFFEAKKMVISDRELLEFAAKANWFSELDDVSIRWGDTDQCILYIHADNQDHNGLDREYRWNPLEDDGDALRLAVKLDIGMTSKKNHAYEKYTSVAVFNEGQSRITEKHKLHSGDAEKATRYVIVRAAADIGKSIPEDSQ